MLAKKTSKNQITLPKKIVDSLPATAYFEVSLKEGGIFLRPVVIESGRQSLEKVREKIRRLGLTEKDIDAAVRWARHPGK